MTASPRSGPSGWVQAVSVLALVGGVIGGALLLRQVPEEEAEIHPTRLFEQVMSHVRRHGVDSLSEGELFRLAADGLVQELDDEFATLIPSGGAVDLHADAGGLGLRLFSRLGRIGVLGVLAGSPAARAGVRPGDEILDIDEGSSGRLGLGQAVAALNDEPGTTVRIRIRRPGLGQVMEYRLARERVRQRVLTGPLELVPGTWYLALPYIGSGSGRAVRTALREVPAGDRMVLDLRGASGGDLDEAVTIAGLFLSDDLPVVRLMGRDTAADVRTTGRDGARHEGPVVVLVDGGTADAGEVIAGALQDHDRALLAGDRTFGRGQSQQDFPLTDRWTVRISTGRWETPLGRRIQRELPAAEPDDSSEHQPPVVRTAGGREVVGGGGITPDSLVSPDPLAPEALALLRAVGAALPAFDSLLRVTAMGIAERASEVAPAYRPGRQEVQAFRQALATRLVLDRLLLDAASGFLADRLGAMVVEEKLGPEGLAVRAQTTDPILRLALKLAVGAATADALVLDRPGVP